MGKAAALCYARYSTAMEAIFTVLEAKKESALKVRVPKLELTEANSILRDNLIEEKYQRWEDRNNDRNASILARIQEDYEICLERVSQYQPKNGGQEMSATEEKKAAIWNL